MIMNEYIPETSYQEQPDLPQAGGNNLRYTNVILTILLAVVLICGGILIAMLARRGKETADAGRELQNMAEEVSDIGNELIIISDNLDTIYGQSDEDDNTVTEPDYGIGGGKRKPAIYIYGEDTRVHVELELKDDEMSVLWPAAEQNGNAYSWDVTAAENGTLTDSEGTEYSYLFWETDSYDMVSFEKGFCVPGSDTAEFLWTELKEIGLSDKEANEFIVYWLPLMQDNDYNLISFEGLDASDDYNRDYALRVTDENGKAADSMLRVMMIWKALDEPEDIEPQSFTGFERSGLTVVEWGGSEVK